MRVVLIKEVKGLGKANDVVDVSTGYAKNFLFKKQLAMEATPANMNIVKTRRKAESAKSEHELEEAREIAARIEGMSLTIPVKCGEGGRLYGAVTAIDIAASLKKEGVRIDKRNVNIDHPIKNLGDYKIDIRLHPEVTATLAVQIVAM